MGKDKKDLAVLRNDYKAPLPKAERDLFKKQDVITKLNSTVTCLHELDDKLIEDYQSFFQANGKLLDKPEKELPNTPPQDTRNSVP